MAVQWPSKVLNDVPFASRDLRLKKCVTFSKYSGLSLKSYCLLPQKITVQDNKQEFQIISSKLLSNINHLFEIVGENCTINTGCFELRNETMWYTTIRSPFLAQKCTVKVTVNSRNLQGFTSWPFKSFH